MTDGDSWKLHKDVWDVMAHIMLFVIPLYTTTYHQFRSISHKNCGNRCKWHTPPVPPLPDIASNINPTLQKQSNKSYVPRLWIWLLQMVKEWTPKHHCVWLWMHISAWVWNEHCNQHEWMKQQYCVTDKFNEITYLVQVMQPWCKLFNIPTQQTTQ